MSLIFLHAARKSSEVLTDRRLCLCLGYS